MIDITKIQRSPSKEQRVTEFLYDSDAMRWDMGNAKEMVIAELRNDNL